MFHEENSIDIEEERDFDLDNVSGQNTQDSILENTPLQFLSATSILHENVENYQGENLGEIKNIMLDVQSGKIEYLVIEFGGFLGFGRKLFAIPFNAITIDPDRRIIIINKSKKELEDAPGFDKNHWPETNSRHFEDVNYYWGYMRKEDIKNLNL